jgi:adenylate cyclase
VAFAVDDISLYELARGCSRTARCCKPRCSCLVWTHRCSGIHYWLRLTPAYRAVLPVVLFLAIAVPLSSLGGLMVPGRAVALLIENPQMLARVKDATSWPSVTNGEALVTYTMAGC